MKRLISWTAALGACLVAAACALGLTPAQTDGDPKVVEEITGGRCPAGGN